MAQYGEPIPESGLRNSFVKQMEQKLAYTEQLGLFYTQQFVSAFVVAARHIPGILCSLKIAQEVENAQERLQLTKAEPPSLEMLQQTRFPATEFEWREGEVVLSFVPPAPIDFVRRETIMLPAEGEIKWVIVTLPWRKEEESEIIV